MTILDTLSAAFPITAYQKRVQALFDGLYWPIMQRIIPPPNMPKANVRFPTATACRAEAREMAKFHAGMLPRFGLYKIIFSQDADPWQRYPGTNVGVAEARRAAGHFVIDTRTEAVYDHRVRYCIPEPWAYQLGFVNPSWVWDRMGAPEKNPYAGASKNPLGQQYYDAKGVLKTRAGYVA